MNIAHRDIKPENIMMDENVLKIIDFGISDNLNDISFTQHNLEENEVKSNLEEESKLNIENLSSEKKQSNFDQAKNIRFKGTLNYMPPECLNCISLFKNSYNGFLSKSL